MNFIPQRCLVDHNPALRRYGDCWRTCVASIMGLPAASVPHFGDNDNDRWLEDTVSWLEPRGWTLVGNGFRGMRKQELLTRLGASNPGVYFIFIGASRNPNENHAVVARDGGVVHDPSGVGIEGPCGDTGEYYAYFIIRRVAR